jgi:hypothetical protein
LVAAATTRMRVNVAVIDPAQARNRGTLVELRLTTRESDRPSLSEEAATLEDSLVQASKGS